MQNVVKSLSISIQSFAHTREKLCCRTLDENNKYLWLCVYASVSIHPSSLCQLRVRPHLIYYWLRGISHYFNVSQLLLY